MFGSVGVLADVIWTHPANEGRRVRALARSAGWQIYKRTVGKPFDLEAFGFRFRCYPDSHDAGRMIYFNNLPDPQEMAFMRRYLRPGDRVIDAGANVGIYTLFLASIVGPTGSILSFEPDPKTADRLRENVELNDLKNVTVIEAALSNYEGTAEFTQGADSGNTLYSLRTYGRPSQTVKVTTLNREAKGDFALCKMDIEGAEIEALEGADLSKLPVITLELADKILARSGRTVEDAQRWLEKRGYTLWSFDGDELTPFENKPRKPGQVGDAIAISDMDLVRARLIRP